MNEQECYKWAFRGSKRLYLSSLGKLASGSMQNLNVRPNVAPHERVDPHAAIRIENLPSAQ